MEQPSAYINNLDIKRFKSIKDINIFHCKKINLIIGKPNSGKSNILEALSFFCAPFSDDKKFLSNFIRYKDIIELFYDFDLTSPVEVSGKNYAAFLDYRNGIDMYAFFATEKLMSLRRSEWRVPQTIDALKASFDANAANPSPNVFPNIFLGIRKSGEMIYYEPNVRPNPVKKYHFREPTHINSPFAGFLNPNADNLYQIIFTNSRLKEHIRSLLKPYNLRLLLNNTTKSFEIQKIEGEISYTLPYHLTPDTFQRLIYYLAAVLSNENSVLLFEEPEAHSFPPYIDTLVKEIIDSTSNQFFITTHSPYVISDFLDKADFSELNIVIAYYEDFQTKIKVLLEEELNQIREYGIDVFYNLDKFLSK